MTASESEELKATLLDAWSRFSDVMSDWLSCQSGTRSKILHAFPPPMTEEERRDRLDDLKCALSELSNQEGFAHDYLQLEYRRLMCKRIAAK